MNNSHKINSIERLMNTIQDKVLNFTESQMNHIERLSNIGIALSSLKNIDELFDLILKEAIEYTNADGATIYTVSKDKKFLEFQIVYNNSMNLMQGGTHSKINWPSVPVFDSNNKPIINTMVGYVTATGKSLNIEDVYNQQVFDISGTIKIDTSSGYRSKSMLAIPMKNHEDNVIGILQLINAMQEDKIVPFDISHQTFITSLASQAAVALTNKKLAEELENLLSQFIKSIASAIDHKSKCTGGHIQRVAQISIMLANEVVQAKSGHFADITFNDDELRELSHAAWMHDLGKIITPSHIMDKSKKLETIFDKIELLEVRFELVKNVISGDIKVKKIKNEDGIEDLEKLISYISEEIIFLKELNKGMEFVDDTKMERLKNIYYFRYHSDGKSYFLINENEFTSLSIKRGTLLPEEFNVMKEHVSITENMLSKLTFPKKLQNIPIYASQHHEKLNGKGYPKGLTSKDIPLQSRIIAIADIFEALTDNKRPYKSAMPVEKALTIIADAVKRNEIDQNLFELLLDTKLYKKYFRIYLPDRENEKVNINKLKNIINKND